MTHDLIKNVLMGLETQVHKVVVTELKGRYVLCGDLAGARRGEVISRLDSRPSDALALALRVDWSDLQVEEVSSEDRRSWRRTCRIG